MRSPQVTKVEISDDLRRKLEAVPDTNIKKDPFNPEIDAVILEYWPKKHKSQLAKTLGINEDRMRQRYRELTGSNIDVT